MTLPRPDISEIQQLLSIKREHAWSEIILKYGKTFRYQGMLVTCDPRLVETLLMKKVHTEQRSIVYKLMGRIPIRFG